MGFSGRVGAARSCWEGEEEKQKYLSPFTRSSSWIGAAYCLEEFSRNWEAVICDVLLLSKVTPRCRNPGGCWENKFCVRTADCSYFEPLFFFTTVVGLSQQERRSQFCKSGQSGEGVCGQIQTLAEEERGRGGLL